MAGARFLAPVGLPALPGPPLTPEAGFVYYDTGYSRIGSYDGSDWYYYDGVAGDLPVFIQDGAPSYVGKYLWIQTGLGGGSDFTFWFEDGV